MEWIHCNTCFKQPRSRDPNFVLSSCGHIFCKDCENRDKADHCIFCNAPCMFVNLSCPMKPQVKNYFEDLESKLRSALDACRFQKSHRLNLFKKHARVVEEHRALKQENHFMKKTMKKMARKLESFELRQNGVTHQSPANDNFSFTPNVMNRSKLETPSIAKRPVHPQNTGSIGSRQNDFQFAMPNLQSYQQYRNAQRFQSPGSESTNTPDRFARQFNDRMHFAPYPHAPRNAPGILPMKTPPYDDLNRLQINDRRNRM